MRRLSTLRNEVTIEWVSPIREHGLWAGCYHLFAHDSGRSLLLGLTGFLPSFACSPPCEIEPLSNVCRPFVVMGGFLVVAVIILLLFTIL